jgi:formylglycine-generating enzyme required for sulfatase activity
MRSPRSVLALLLALFAAVWLSSGCSGSGDDYSSWYPGPWWSACPEIDCPLILPTPPGSYTMGTPQAPDESFGSPPHEVTIEYPVAISPEVTRAQFARFVSETGYNPAPGCVVAAPADNGVQLTEAAAATWQTPGLPPPLQGSDEPVVCVNWHDARAYVNWLNSETGLHFRLLSESEWEYVARAGTTGRYFWDNTDATAYCIYANTLGIPAVIRPPQIVNNRHIVVPCNDRHVGTAPINAMSVNRFQVADMLGNVEEWVEDCYAPTYDLVPSDGSPYEKPIVSRKGRPIRGCAVRTVRGGSWKDRPDEIGVAIRHSAPARERTNFRGFRISLSCAVDRVCVDGEGKPIP